MKSILDDPRIYKQLDSLDTYISLSRFGRQFESGWHDAQFFNLDFEIDKVKNIVLVGMGASNLPAKVVHALAPLLLSLPFEIVSNYRLPAYVNTDTLVILSSYSGNTEEILSCAQDAKQRHCKTVVITTGGRLKDYAIIEQIPVIALDSKLNVSRVSRMGLGLSLGALVSLLVRLNQSSYRYFDSKTIVHTIDRVVDMVNVHKPANENPAKSLAQKHKGQGVIIFTANHLSGVGETAINFIHETSKTFSVHISLPDMNHHFLDGLIFPTSLKDHITFLILNSHLYPETIQRRIQITKDILLKQKYHLTLIKPESTDLVSQVFESLVFFIFFSYYLSIVNKVDPGTNPWVNYLKNQ